MDKRDSQPNICPKCGKPMRKVQDSGFWWFRCADCNHWRMITADMQTQEESVSQSK